MNDHNWTIRDAVGDDLPFIYSTWGKSYRYDSPLGKSCKNSIFFPFFNQVMDWVLEQPDTKVIVAVDPAHSNVIYGYVIYQPGVLHYAFTKEAFQRWGIATSLIKHADMPQVYTLKTFMSKPIMGKHPEMDFNPFLLFKQGAQYGSSSTESDQGASESGSSLLGT